MLTFDIGFGGPATSSLSYSIRKPGVKISGYVMVCHNGIEIGTIL